MTIDMINDIKTNDAGTNNINYRELENNYGFNVYPKRDVVIIKGKGAKVWDETGKEYIDCAAGHGVANIGHCNDKVIEAIDKQAKRLITCSGVFYNDVRALMLEKLINISPSNLNKIFLCNSGAESIEAAIKFARYNTKKTDFVCANRGFHGRTLGSLSATFNPKYKEGFEPLLPGFSWAPFNNFEKLKELVTDNTAGIILEIVQGESGIIIGEEKFFRQVKELCDERGIVLIVDEVQSGFCRTGKMFACNHFNLQPDIMCVAKALAGGVPMGAVICSDKIDLPMGVHGTTFGGNPLSCAAALAALNFMLDERLDLQAQEKGAYFKKRFTEHSLSKVREIRQLGLMIGIELKEKNKPFILKLLEKGVLVLPSGTTVIRLLPPLTISYEELDVVVKELAETLA